MLEILGFSRPNFGSATGFQNKELGNCLTREFHLDPGRSAQQLYPCQALLGSVPGLMGFLWRRGLSLSVALAKLRVKTDSPLSPQSPLLTHPCTLSSRALPRSTPSTHCANIPAHFWGHKVSTGRNYFSWKWDLINPGDQSCRESLMWMF